MAALPARCKGCGNRVFYMRSIVTTVVPGANQYGKHMKRLMDHGPFTWCEPNGEAHSCLNRTAVPASVNGKSRGAATTAPGVPDPSCPGAEKMDTTTIPVGESSP